MNRNSIIDAWLSMSRGRRRATVIMAVVVLLLAAAQMFLSRRSGSSEAAPADYSVLEQEIALFRSLTDTIPPGERPPAYVRHTHVVYDTAATPSVQPATVQARSLQPVPRLRSSRRDTARTRH